jgi:hypothetical protein
MSFLDCSHIRQGVAPEYCTQLSPVEIAAQRYITYFRGRSIYSAASPRIAYAAKDPVRLGTSAAVGDCPAKVAVSNLSGRFAC